MYALRVQVSFFSFILFYLTFHEGLIDLGAATCDNLVRGHYSGVEPLVGKSYQVMSNDCSALVCIL